MLDEFDFELDTAAHCSCSTVMAGKMWVFGGFGSRTRQLSTVTKCRLKKEGQLPFDLERGAANTIEGFNGVQMTILCFHDAAPYKSCHS